MIGVVAQPTGLVRSKRSLKDRLPTTPLFSGAEACIYNFCYKYFDACLIELRAGFLNDFAVFS